MNEKEQSNTMLYVVVFIGLIIIGVVKAGFVKLFSTMEVDVATLIISEIVGAVLLGGLFVFIIQRVTTPTQQLNDKFEIFSKEQDRIRTVQEKILATGTHPAVPAEKPKTQSSKPTSTPVSTPAPKPVAVAEPTPPPPPPKTEEEILEEQLEQELEAIHFDDIFAEYKAERDEARARGENFDDDDTGTLVSD